MSRYSRRDFIKATAAAGAAVTLNNVPLSAETRRATDCVTLGKSGIKVTRLAFGTGSHGGAVQRNLGQEGFNRLVRHAYDRGIRFFETSDTYDDMHRMLGIALKGIPRDSYRLMTKVTTNSTAIRSSASTSCASRSTPTTSTSCCCTSSSAARWPTKPHAGRTPLSKPRIAKIILARGASVHGLPALRQVPTSMAPGRHDPHEPQRHPHGYGEHRRRPTATAMSLKSSTHPSRPARPAWASSA